MNKAGLNTGSLSLKNLRAKPVYTAYLVVVCSIDVFFPKMV